MSAAADAEAAPMTPAMPRASAMAARGRRRCAELLIAADDAAAPRCCRRAERRDYAEAAPRRLLAPSAEMPMPSALMLTR